MILETLSIVAVFAVLVFGLFMVLSLRQRGSRALRGEAGRTTRGELSGRELPPISRDPNESIDQDLMEQRNRLRKSG